MIDQNGNKVLCAPSVLYNEDSAIATVTDAGVFAMYLWVSPTHDSANSVHFKIFGPEMDLIYEDDDLHTPKVGSDSDIKLVLEALSALVSFLEANAEARDESSENYSLFPERVRRLAYSFSDGLSMLGLELAEELNMLDVN